MTMKAGVSTVTVPTKMASIRRSVKAGPVRKATAGSVRRRKQSDGDDRQHTERHQYPHRASPAPGLPDQDAERQPGHDRHRTAAHHDGQRPAAVFVVTEEPRSTRFALAEHGEAPALVSAERIGGNVRASLSVG